MYHTTGAQASPAERPLASRAIGARVPAVRKPTRLEGWMKVTDVDIHVVSVPFTHPETWRFGRMWGLTNAIVEVHTDEGITGIGEVPAAR